MSTSTNHLPESKDTCILYMINTGTNLVTPSKPLVEPVVQGHELLNLPTFSWLIVNKRSQKHVLFDLGARKDWEDLPPHVAAIIESSCAGIRVTDDVPSVLGRAGIPLDNIKAVILSHWHFDHTGDLSAFPKSVAVVVGPGFRSQFAPFFPESAESPFHSHEFEGRDLVELGHDSFEAKVASFRAHDFFGDGSFYLLHAPGHTKEHVIGLVRTTSSPTSTFVVLGADSCHFSGVIRPTLEQPMPLTFDEQNLANMPHDLPRPCPCSHFIQLHHDQDHSRVKPFYSLATASGSFYVDTAEARKTIANIATLDSMENVLVTIAHDPTLGEVLPTVLDYPGSDSSINRWKEMGWKDKLLWGWLKELPRNGEKGMPHLVDGVWKGGSKVRGLPSVDDLM